ncbi:hypothetical protein JOB34_11430 [Allobranchiibius sp. GilTou38]|nr:hypothetical protein [Allobranchiibius sp. GilTou38]
MIPVITRFGEVYALAVDVAATDRRNTQRAAIGTVSTAVYAPAGEVVPDATVDQDDDPYSARWTLIALATWPLPVLTVTGTLNE